MELRFNHAFMLRLRLQLQLDVRAFADNNMHSKKKTVAQNNIIDGEGMVKVYAFKKNNKK